MAELSKAELNELVEQAVVDAHDGEEQMSGFYNMIENSLALPFTTTVLGVQANVESIDLTDSGIVAICSRGAHRQAISILDLPLPVPPPAGHGEVPLDVAQLPDVGIPHIPHGLLAPPGPGIAISWVARRRTRQSTG